MRTNDVTIAAYPKSGITWLSFLLAVARLSANGLHIRPTFFNIDWLVIDSHKMAGQEYAHIWNDGMGDFIKTHGNWQNVPNVIYLLRNPYDTLKSNYHFTVQLGQRQPIEPFVETQASLWNQHVTSWLLQSRYPSQSLFLVEYEQLGAEIVYEVGYQLGFEWDVSEVSREAMQRQERQFEAHNPNYRRHHLEFVREGDSREVEGFEKYRKLIEERCGAVYAQARA